MLFNELEDFLSWYQGLNPNEEIDMSEVLTIFLNQNYYMECI